MHVLLVISGSVAAYKALELIRLLRKRGDSVDAILTNGGAAFITPLAVSALTGKPTYTDLFSLKDEAEMGHIRLTREADCVMVAPASADLIAKLAHGLADDLASATLLASDKKIHVAPAMNARMWSHPATQRNLAQLQADGAVIISPEAGALACGEIGPGRMAEPEAILAAILPTDVPATNSLAGRHLLVTAGPTREPLDPVRYLGNHSSGKQGYAIAEAAAALGARVTLVSGPTALACPAGVVRCEVETAREMEALVGKALPADVFVAAAAVADWRPAETAVHKMKKRASTEAPGIALIENPDILAGVARGASRPSLVIGFALETDASPTELAEKRRRKGCDWLLANGPVFGADETELTWFDASGSEAWGRLGKRDAAHRLTARIAQYFASPPQEFAA